MDLILVHIGSSSQAKDGTEPLVQGYLGRCGSFLRCRTEAFRSEEAFFAWIEHQHSRIPAVSVLLDSRGKQISSESFAAWLGARRDEGTQHMIVAIGPADGWSAEARGRANLLLSFGSMTLAHTLARLVAAEQIYRAVAILTGHPYHSGH